VTGGEQCTVSAQQPKHGGTGTDGGAHIANGVVVKRLAGIADQNGGSHDGQGSQYAQPVSESRRKNEHAYYVGDQVQRAGMVEGANHYVPLAKTNGASGGVNVSM
jgi:hypothetical protein